MCEYHGKKNKDLWAATCWQARRGDETTERAALEVPEMNSTLDHKSFLNREYAREEHLLGCSRHGWVSLRGIEGQAAEKAEKHLYMGGW